MYYPPTVGLVGSKIERNWDFMSSILPSSALLVATPARNQEVSVTFAGSNFLSKSTRRIKEYNFCNLTFNDFKSLIKLILKGWLFEEYSFCILTFNYFKCLINKKLTFDKTHLEEMAGTLRQEGIAYHLKPGAF